MKTDTRLNEYSIEPRLLFVVTFILLINPIWYRANGDWDIQTSSGELKKTADSVLTLMAFTVLPDITTSSLSISSAKTDNPGIWQTSFGGGFTVSKEFPLYLEGALGYSRYDPDFIATDGQEQRQIPIKWNSFAATVGIGGNFPLTTDEELRLRPIFNFTLGYVTTDVALAQDLLNEAYNLDLNLIDDGRMNAYGIGGALMLDYEKYRDDYEIDVEVRYTYIHLQSYGGQPNILKAAQRPIPQTYGPAGEHRPAPYYCSGLYVTCWNHLLPPFLDRNAVHSVLTILRLSERASSWTAVLIK